MRFCEGLAAQHSERCDSEDNAGRPAVDLRLTGGRGGICLSMVMMTMRMMMFFPVSLAECISPPLRPQRLANTALLAALLEKPGEHSDSWSVARAWRTQLAARLAKPGEKEAKEEEVGTG